MKSRNATATLSIALTLALTLAACGNSDSPDAMDDMDHSTMDHSTTDHSGMDISSSTPGDTGMTTGTIRSVGENGDFLTIAHERIEGVGMDAMTMGFDIMSSVDLSDYEAGDRVAFAVKKGRDGSYRITAICETTGTDMSCLN